MTVISEPNKQVFLTLCGEGTLYVMYDNLKNNTIKAIKLCTNSDYIDWLVNHGETGLIEMYSNGDWYTDTEIDLDYYLLQLHTAIAKLTKGRVELLIPYSRSRLLIKEAKSNGISVKPLEGRPNVYIFECEDNPTKVDTFKKIHALIEV